MCMSCSKIIIACILLPCHTCLCLCFCCTDIYNKAHLVECLIYLWLLFPILGMDTSFMIDTVVYLLATTSAGSQTSCPNLTCNLTICLWTMVFNWIQVEIQVGFLFSSSFSFIYVLICYPFEATENWIQILRSGIKALLFRRNILVWYEFRMVPNTCSPMTI